MENSNFHHFSDGRGSRRVFVNGNEIKQVIWADVDRGVLLHHPLPLRLHKRKHDEIYSRKLKGAITVEFTEGGN